MENCICSSPNASLNNTHFKHLNMRAILLNDSEGYGIIVLENNKAIACFDINFCPICGRNLKGAV